MRCTRACRKVLPQADQRAVGAVELLADVFLDDARLHLQAVALGGVGGTAQLCQGPFDDRTDDHRHGEQRQPFGEKEMPEG